MAKTFGQGLDVDRDRPHIFHRDYWPLRVLREGIRDFLSSHAAELKNAKALDLGAGDSPYRAPITDAGIFLTCADIDPTDPAVLPIQNGRVPLPDGSIDLVLSTQVLEHVPDVPAYLREAFRLLRPGGLLYLTTHGAFILHRHPTDFRRWTTDGLRYELEQCGFTVERIDPRIGILAISTHLRSMTLGGLTRRIPLTGWLRPLIYLFSNLRMGLEEMLTPQSAMESHPELLLATARKPQTARTP